MSFKTHLLIITTIIILVFAAWQYMYGTAPAPVVVEQTVSNEPANESRAIEIIRASWGLNCSNVPLAAVKEEPLANYADDNRKTSPLADNNVLEAVTKLCNGKLTCEIAINTATLGPDPMPQCYDKQLVVEYRCFAFDRPWLLKSSHAPMVIDCTKRGS